MLLPARPHFKISLFIFILTTWILQYHIMNKSSTNTLQLLICHMYYDVIRAFLLILT